MRTRNQAKRHGESPSGVASEQQSGTAASCHGEGFLNAVSEEAVGRLLKRASSRKTSGSRGRPRPERHHASWETRDKMTLTINGKGQADDDPLPGSSAVPGCTSDKCSENIIQCDANEVDWEEGMIPSSECRDGYSHELGKEVTVVLTESPSSAQRRPSRRISVEDKELAELVHKVHLLCLLARGRLVDRACNDPEIQASLLSILPLNLLKLAEVSALTANVLGPLVNWFHDTFHLKSQCTDHGSFNEKLAFALEAYEGTNEEIAALSVALFRALNLTTRFVSSLDVASLKPDADMPENSNSIATRLNTKISSSISAASSANQIHTPDHGLIDNPSNTTWNKYSHMNLVVASTFQDENHASSQVATANVATCSTDIIEGSKRKGDLEFELQMAMALAATAKEDLIANKIQDNSSLSSPHAKKMRIMKAGESSISSRNSTGTIWSRNNGPPLYWAEVYCVDETLTGRWVHVDAANGLVDCEEKVEPASAVCKKPLRYAVAFSGNGAKDVTRRYCRHWYRIASQRINSHWWDSVLASLKERELGETGGEEIQESVSGVMVGDNEVHHPLKSLPIKTLDGSFPGCSNNLKPESIADSKQTGGSNDNHTPVKNRTLSNRNSLEDMDLETRALTEPLPTNQLAYKNHNLYALERWLTKYQVLHPKGPIVGYCSGHPVYPRSCVQTVQTRQKWLRDGLQVREREIPAKTLKQSKKSEKYQLSDTDCTVEGEEKTIELFGRWQLEPLQLPHAVDGIVPKNAYGRVDVWSEKCLPPGTVHLRLPRLVPVARRLGIDYANAMVGFEFRSGRSYPVYEGIVVCTEFRDAIMEAYLEEEENRETEQRRKNEADALSRWFQLLSSMITRQRLESSYAASSATTLYNPPSNPCEHDATTQMEDLSGNNLEMNRSQFQDHEHVFLAENQSLEGDGVVRMKRCACGFSVQVEEL